jgi:hypothetical protein
VTGEQTLSAPSHEQALAGWASALIAPAAATTVAYTPNLLFRPDLWDHLPGHVVLVWFVVPVVAAPVTVALMNRPTGRDHAGTSLACWVYPSYHSSSG